METLRKKEGFIIDMDGVIYHGNRLLPGVKEFVQWLMDNNKHFLFLTNSGQYTPRELQKKLERMGLDIDERRFYTSALATAYFLDSQAPGCSAYVIGEHGVLNALYDKGITYNDVDPDYVVVGEASSYNLEQMTKAIRLVNAGAKLIGTNSDLTGPTETGIAPACRALISPIELATGKSAYLFCRQAQPPDDAHRSAASGRTLGKRRHDWRPHGHGHYRRHRDRPGHRAGAVWRHRTGGRCQLSLPPQAYSGRRG